MAGMMPAPPLPAGVPLPKAARGPAYERRQTRMRDETANMEVLMADVRASQQTLVASVTEVKSLLEKQVSAEKVVQSQLELQGLRMEQQHTEATKKMGKDPGQTLSPKV